MATLASLTLDVLDLCYGQTPLTRPSSDTLAAAVQSATDTSWRFATAGTQMWEKDDYAEYFDGTGTAGEIVQFTADHDNPRAPVEVLRGQRRSTAKAATSLGAATFDVTGGASEDLWTLASHGLSVGDEVLFSAVGTGAEPYAVNTSYWVAAVPSSSTFQLSATKSTTVLEGTGSDSSGTWTLVTPPYTRTSVFLKNPTFTQVEIQRAINETIDQDMQNGIWYRSNRTLTWATGRNRYPANASDYKIERMYQRDTSSTSIGTSTFLFTGSAVEDEWTTSSAHGLSVGDMVRFSAAGTGADEYAAGIIYWVATVPTTTTLQLSATESTTVLEGTADSVGTWTMEKVVFSFNQFQDYDYEFVTNVDTGADSTGKSIIVRRVASTNDTIYYTARTRPSSSSVASLPTELSNAVPYGALARLLGGTATRVRHAPAASQQSTVAYADAAWFRTEFNRQIDQTRVRLLKELKPLAHWQYGPINA